MNPLAQPIDVFFSVCMWWLRHVRRSGLFGTPNIPIYYDAGEQVPWWVLARWPLSLDLRFSADCETFYEDGEQRVYPLRDWPHKPVEATKEGMHGWSGFSLCGAPTVFYRQPRPYRPELQPAILSAWKGRVCAVKENSPLTVRPRA